MASSEFDLREVRLYVDETGPEDAPAALLVHGWGCDGHAFDRFERAAELRALVPDLRGHGGSGRVPGRHTIPAMARDLEQLLEVIPRGPVLAVGHSMGGNVVVELAIRRPDLVSAVVVIDPAYNDPAWAEAPSRIADLAERGAAAAVDGVPGAFAPGADPALVHAVAATTGATPAEVLIEGLRSTYLDRDSFGHAAKTGRRLRHLTVPLLALYPDPDRAARARLLPVDQTVVEIGGAGHFLHEEQPEAVWASIRAWLRDRGVVA